MTGKSQIDQVEIARAVLRRGDDFNPIDDSTVRKIGSLLRQRLDKYYQHEGAADPVVITLPVRSYVPIFRERSPAGAAISSDAADSRATLEQAPLQGSARQWVWWASAVLLVALGLGGGYLWRDMRASPQPLSSEFQLYTVKGDFMHLPLDMPGSAIQVGPELLDREDFIARLFFRPGQAEQQAGLLMFRDADNYVKLTRHFISRVNLEFGAERNGIYPKPPGTFQFDPSGQDGRPIWLTIRRIGQSFEGFHSHDGDSWAKTGNTLPVALPTAGVRAAFFANRSRTDSTEVPAQFDNLSHGLVFHDMEEEVVKPGSLPGWKLQSWGEAAGNLRMEHSALLFDFNIKAPAGMTLSRPVTPGDWTIQTRVDLVPSGGSAAGLHVTGSKGTLRVMRWDLGGGSISVEQQWRKQINHRDFEGWPPVTLFLECRNGRLKARYTRDGSSIQELPVNTPIEELGTGLTAGLYAGRPSWAQGVSTSQARFSWFLEEIHKTSNFH